MLRSRPFYGFDLFANEAKTLYVTPKG
jgi:hypothetical protein